LHLAVQQLLDDPDEYELFKRIIKELMFNGADRSKRNIDGQTALDLLLQSENPHDYFTQKEYNKLRLILSS